MFVHPHKIGRRLLNVSQLSEKIGKSRSSIWMLVKDGTIPAPVKIGGATRWDETEIDRWLDRLLAERETEAA